jgi:hypothetical protein
MDSPAFHEKGNYHVFQCVSLETETFSSLCLEGLKQNCRKGSVSLLAFHSYLILSLGTTMSYLLGTKCAILATL